MGMNRAVAIREEFQVACSKGQISRALRALASLETLLPATRVPFKPEQVARNGDYVSNFEAMYIKFLETWTWTVGIEHSPWLLQAWLSAIARRDVASLCMLVAIVERGWKNPPHAHRQRTLLLMLKDILEARTKLQGVPAQLELSRLADMLAYPKTGKVDGYASLRRLAKRLEFPLARAQRGPKFKTTQS
jgi:hypothetical protein